jgi:hypothetical protein
LAYRIRDVHDDYLDIGPENGSAELEAFLAGEDRLGVLRLN